MKLSRILTQLVLISASSAHAIRTRGGIRGRELRSTREGGSGNMMGGGGGGMENNMMGGMMASEDDSMDDMSEEEADPLQATTVVFGPGGTAGLPPSDEVLGSLASEVAFDGGEILFFQNGNFYVGGLGPAANNPLSPEGMENLDELVNNRAFGVSGEGRADIAFEPGQVQRVTVQVRGTAAGLSVGATAPGTTFPNNAALEDADGSLIVVTDEGTATIVAVSNLNFETLDITASDLGGSSIVGLILMNAAGGNSAVALGELTINTVAPLASTTTVFGPGGAAGSPPSDSVLGSLAGDVTFDGGEILFFQNGNFYVGGLGPAANNPLSPEGMENLDELVNNRAFGVSGDGQADIVFESGQVQRVTVQVRGTAAGLNVGATAPGTTFPNNAALEDADGSLMVITDVGSSITVSVGNIDFETYDFTASGLGGSSIVRIVLINGAGGNSAIALGELTINTVAPLQSVTTVFGPGGTAGEPPSDSALGSLAGDVTFEGGEILFFQNGNFYIGGLGPAASNPLSVEGMENLEALVNNRAFGVVGEGNADIVFSPGAVKRVTVQVRGTPAGLSVGATAMGTTFPNNAALEDANGAIVVYTNEGATGMIPITNSNYETLAFDASELGGSSITRISLVNSASGNSAVIVGELTVNTVAPLGQATTVFGPGGAAGELPSDEVLGSLAGEVAFDGGEILFFQNGNFYVGGLGPATNNPLSPEGMENLDELANNRAFGVSGEGEAGIVFGPGQVQRITVQVRGTASGLSVGATAPGTTFGNNAALADAEGYLNVYTNEEHLEMIPISNENFETVDLDISVLSGSYFTRISLVNAAGGNSAVLLGELTINTVAPPATPLLSATTIFGPGGTAGEQPSDDVLNTLAGEVTFDGGEIVFFQNGNFYIGGGLGGSAAPNPLSLEGVDNILVQDPNNRAFGVIGEGTADILFPLGEVQRVIVQVRGTAAGLSVGPTAPGTSFPNNAALADAAGTIVVYTDAGVQNTISISNANFETLVFDIADFAGSSITRVSLVNAASGNSAVVLGELTINSY